MHIIKIDSKKRTHQANKSGIAYQLKDDTQFKEDWSRLSRQDYQTILDNRNTLNPQLLKKLASFCGQGPATFCPSTLIKPIISPASFEKDNFKLQALPQMDRNSITVRKHQVSLNASYKLSNRDGTFAIEVTVFVCLNAKDKLPTAWVACDTKSAKALEQYYNRTQFHTKNDANLDNPAVTSAMLGMRINLKPPISQRNLVLFIAGILLIAISALTGFGLLSLGVGISLAVTNLFAIGIYNLLPKHIGKHRPMQIKTMPPTANPMSGESNDWVFKEAPNHATSVRRSMANDVFNENDNRGNRSSNPQAS